MRCPARAAARPAPQSTQAEPLKAVSSDHRVGMSIAPSRTSMPRKTAPTRPESARVQREAGHTVVEVVMAAGLTVALAAVAASAFTASLDGTAYAETRAWATS